MADYVLNAEVRSKTGKSPSRQLRASGRIPAVIYGSVSEPIHCIFGLRDLEKVLAKSKRNSIYKIEFNDKTKAQEVILRDYQIHPISRHYEHVDFQAIDMTKPLQIEVDIKLVGEPIGRKTGAVLTVQTKTLRIECLPSQIPPCFELNIETLDAGGSMHVADIPKTEFKVVSNPKLTICQMSIIKEEVVEVAPGAVATADAAGAVPAAGAAPAAAGAAPAAAGAAPAAAAAKKDPKKG